MCITCRRSGIPTVFYLSSRYLSVYILVRWMLSDSYLYLVLYY